MATRAAPKLPSLGLAELQQKLVAQFRGLNPNDPASWPLLPRLAACVALAIVIVVVLWFGWLSTAADELQAEVAKEQTLRQDFTKKLAQAINLEALKKQREQVQQYVTQLEKQLPSKAEMDALLSDINQAGIGRSLSFELFRPGSVNVKEYYAELPIALRVSGKYHDIGAFASDIANLSRIVTLNNVNVIATPPPAGGAQNGTLAMEATAKTFRYLDTDEIAKQRAAAKQAAAGGAKK
jgi:type IV pilus assembly protein PilO